jgi:hypothetical protein
VNAREALALVRGLLTEALAQPDRPTTFVRDMAERNGALKATMRAAVTVIDQAEGES